MIHQVRGIKPSTGLLGVQFNSRQEAIDYANKQRETGAIVVVEAFPNAWAGWELVKEEANV